jgi:hypothetical protein
MVGMAPSKATAWLEGEAHGEDDEGDHGLGHELKGAVHGRGHGDLEGLEEDPQGHGLEGGHAQHGKQRFPTAPAPRARAVAREPPAEEGAEAVDQGT